jgi:predicted nucleic acid-binding protein
MADFLLDSDVVIWHLRGNAAVVEFVLALARRGRLGLSAITRAEVLLGMRELERALTPALPRQLRDASRPGGDGRPCR